MKHKVCVGRKRTRHILIPLSAAAAASSLMLTLLPPAFAAEAVGDGVTPTCDEAFYGTLDYYGNLTDGSVVKSYTMNGVDKLTDYGDYDDVENLTDGTVPTVSDGVTTFDFGSSVPDHFYFEGKTSKPFSTLPWTIAVSYQLNGLPVKAEELAGKTGVITIQLDIVPNAAASDYAKDNYTLEAAAIFNQDDILSLKAEGAQVQLIGNLRAVLFLALPGEEQHFSMEIGANDFEFDGMTFLMVPATLAQLDDIADISDDKDDLEDDYHKLNGSLDTLLDSLNAMTGSLRDTAGGLDELNDARGTISAGKGQVYGDADKVLADLDSLNDALSTLPAHVDSASQAVTDVTGDLSKLADSAVSLKDQLGDVRDDLNALRDDLADIRNLTGQTDKSGNLQNSLGKLGTDTDALKNDVASLSSTLKSLNLQIGGSGVTVDGLTPDQINESIAQAKELRSSYDSLRGESSAITFPQYLAAALMAGGSSAEDAQTLAPTLAALASVSEADAANLDDTQKAYWQKAQTLAGIYREATGGDLSAGMSFTQFLYAMLRLEGDSASAASQMVQLYGLSQSDLTSGLVSDLSSLCDALGSGGLSGDLKDLTAMTGDTLKDLDDLTDVSDDVLSQLQTVLEQAKDLDDTVNRYVPDLQSTLSDTKTILTATTDTLGDTRSFLSSFEALLKKSGTELDAGTRTSLSGLADTLRKTASSIDTTEDVRTAKNNMCDIIEREWDDHTGDKDNLLNMDSTADAVSLTSAQNASPESVQVLLRTAEIKVPDEEETQTQAAATDDGTFWSRVAAIFKGIWNTITGFFGQ